MGFRDKCVNCHLQQLAVLPYRHTQIIRILHTTTYLQRGVYTIIHCIF